jgi:hypothetical protein
MTSLILALRVDLVASSESRNSRSGLSGIAASVAHVTPALRPNFPETVDEISARLVASGVVAQAAVYLWLRSPISLVVLAVGFAARVLYGPKVSPLARLVVGFVRPKAFAAVAPRMVPGSPKRFAQGIGLVFSGAALVSALAGATGVSVVLMIGLLGAASLEAFAGLCLGCVAFRRLIRLGVIPESVCEACNNVQAHLAARSAAA